MSETPRTLNAAVSAMSPRQLPHVEPRVETGAVQFGADWPGVWIRGDNAAGYALGLTQIAAVIERDTSMPSGMALAGLRGLIRLLTSSNVSANAPQPLDSWHRAEIYPQPTAPVTVEDAQGPAMYPPDTPILAARRQAFDEPTIANLDALIAAVRAEAGHHTLAQGERLIAWRERAEAAEAECQRLRAQLAKAQP